VAKHDSNTVLEFADDTTVVGLIIDNDERAYREEVRDLSLNVSKTKGADRGLQEKAGRTCPH
jgi:hypothetical protein